MTFRQSLNRSFANITIWLAIIGAIMAIGMATDEKESVSRPLPVGSPAFEIERCSPAGSDPIRYAMIQRLNSGVERVKSDRLITKALDDAFNVKNWENVRIIGFCK